MLQLAMARGWSKLNVGICLYDPVSLENLENIVILGTLHLASSH